MTFATRYKRKGPVAIHFGEELSRTKQAHMAECDVNNIVRKAAKNGFFPPPPVDPRYGDFTEAVDYQEAMNIVLQAKSQFDSLSADVRRRFANDPALFLEFCNDPKNAEEMVKMGLAERVYPEPAPIEPTQPKPSQAPQKGKKSTSPPADDENS